MTENTPQVHLEQLEHSKENVLPTITRTRSLHKLSQVLGERPSQRSQLLAQQRLEFENQLRLCEGDNQLQIWWKYIKWMEENFPAGCKDYLPLLERCTSELQDEKRYYNNTKFLKIWLKLAQSLDESLELFQFLGEKGIGWKKSLLYEAWALILESKGDYETAKGVFQRGISAGAKPEKRLAERFKAFQARNESRFVGGEAFVEQKQIAMLNPISTDVASRSHRSREKQMKKSGLGSSTLPNVGQSTEGMNFGIFSENANPEKKASLLSEKIPEWGVFGTDTQRKKENSSRKSEWKAPLDENSSSRDNRKKFDPIPVFGDSSSENVSNKTEKRFPDRRLQTPNSLNQGDSSKISSSFGSTEMLSFEEARALYYNLITPEEGDDMDECDTTMDMTINYSTILSGPTAVTSDGGDEVPVKRSFGTVLDQLHEDDQGDSGLQQDEDDLQSFDCNQEDNTFNFDSGSDPLNFRTGTVTLNTKDALNAVFRMWNGAVDDE